MQFYAAIYCGEPLLVFFGCEGIFRLAARLCGPSHPPTQYRVCHFLFSFEFGRASMLLTLAWTRQNFGSGDELTSAQGPY